MLYKTTKQVVKEIGLTISMMQNAIWNEKFQPPEKISGSFMWDDPAIKRAKKYFDSRRK